MTRKWCCRTCARRSSPGSGRCCGTVPSSTGSPKLGADEPSAESSALTLVERDEVVAALRQLPERQREALVLRSSGDFSEAEIASAMGTSRGAVKSHTARAMSALRQILERTDEIEPRQAPPQMARESAVLATEVAPYLAAALGAYGTAVLTRGEGAVADAAIGAGQRALQRIFGRREGRDELPAVLAEVIEDPDDADYLAVLELEIRRIVESDAAMQADIRAILRDVSPVVTVTQRGHSWPGCLHRWPGYDDHPASGLTRETLWPPSRQGNSQTWARGPGGECLRRIRASKERRGSALGCAWHHGR